MFEWLIKYPIELWREAELISLAGWPWWALAVAIGLALPAVLVSLTRLPLSFGRRVVVAALQAVAIVTALTMLWRPALQVETVQPGENSVAWLVDSSNSMQLVESTDSTRLAQAIDVVEQHQPDAALFTPSFYRLDTALTPIESLSELNNVAKPSDVARTDIAGGVLQLLESVSDTAVAGVVLVSDGVHNADALPAGWWQRIQAAGIPVYTVGVGRDQITEDLELADIELPFVAAPDTQLTARVRIVHERAGTARLRVVAGNDLLAANDLELPPNVSESFHNVTFAAGEEGIRELMFTVKPDWQEPHLTNNQQPRLLDVRKTQRRVLYVEGEPRWEYKFLRRALHNDPAVEIVSLLKTSQNKYYRQGVRDPAELADGFPASREALFIYDALIIGSYDAAQLSAEQQAAIRDFVNIRGGSLLMLAGEQGLADGGWGRSAVAVALPVALSNRNDADTYDRDRVSVLPTAQGMRTDWLVPTDNLDSAIEWGALPQLADQQTVGPSKPGAVVLLEAVDGPNKQPLLIWQRYGQGQSYVLATSGTWRWQMGLPSTDQSHENFWQRFVNHLVSDALPQIAMDWRVPVTRDVSSSELAVVARHADFEPYQQPSLDVEVRAPNGSRQTLTLIPDVATPGRYTGQIDTVDAGPWSVSAALPAEGESPVPVALLGNRNASHRWVKESGTAEGFGIRRDRAFLERIAKVTGGKFLDTSEASALPKLLAASNAALTRLETLPVWNIPLAFFLLFAAKALEWLLRLSWKRL